MKELYTSPEVKLISFLAQENLTADEEDPISVTGTVVDQVLEEDIALPL